MALDKAIIASRDRTRRLVILSVWAVVLLGLPLWWKTTRVYRAELPYDDIEQWNGWKTCQPKFPISINIHLSDKEPLHGSEDNPVLSAINDKFAQELRKSGVSGNTFNIQFRTDQSWNGSEEQDIKDRPSSVPGTYNFYVSPSNVTNVSIKSRRQGFIQVSSWNKDQIVDTVVDTVEVIFKSEEKIIAQLLNNAIDNQATEKVKDQLKAVKYAPEYQLTFSLFSGDASNGVREWKMQEAINTYLAPFLKSMSVISKFTIESQIQHYASLTFPPQLDTEQKEYYLTPEALPQFINAAEWSLASTVSSLPSLNFLVYIPKPSESPLVIKNGLLSPRSVTNSFLVPRWGGITILNRDNSISTAHPNFITLQELEPIMKVFLTQLRDLMGLVDLSSQSTALPITFHKIANEAPTAWELDNLLRRRSAENIVDSLATLRSLARLVAGTPNMVVLDHIQKDVVDALKDIGNSCHSLGQQEFIEALESSRDALVKAETAFFDPTMVSMLYFPDEHKYAIYMPLFVPITVPLVMVLLREVKKWKESKAAAAKAAKEADKTKTE